MNTQFCLYTGKLCLRGISGSLFITCYAAFLKYLQTVYPFFYLYVLNKTLKIPYINGLSTIHRYILTAIYGHPTHFYFLDYRCLYGLLQTSKIDIHKVLTCVGLSKEGKFTTGYYLPTIRLRFRT